MPILMTGGTGFLGLQLLQDQLLRGQQVRLLAHAGGQQALERVRKFLTTSRNIKCLPSTLEDLVTVFDIDINLPNLGLSPTAVHALTHDVEEVWHVAATVMLDGRDGHVWRTNFVGTQNVLSLLTQTPAHALYRHVSTAFVAGRDRETDVYEDASAGVTEFENTYERSKHAAENAVQQWAAESGRSALILRPSILVPGITRQRDLPEHTMHTVGQIVSSIAARSAIDGSRQVLRLGADPRAHLNLVQVDWAATAMRLLGERITRGVEVVHVVHEQDVPIRSLSAALEDVAPVRMRMMPATPAEPTAEERLFYRRIHGFLPYCFHRRNFDTTRMRAYLPDLPAPACIGRDNLSSWMQPIQSQIETIELAGCL